MRCTLPGLAAAILLLAACTSAGGLFAPKAKSPYAPGTVPDEQGIDGLIVGHRLMAAGEYSLALRAYYRGAEEHGATVDVLSAIGSADLKLGRLGQAERLLRRAVEVDARFVPAWNNLGVVLMEKGEVAEASRVFRTAFALDSGQSDEIRDNLRLALAKLDDPAYDSAPEDHFSLVRRGYGEYLLLTKL
ncbi:MAG: tetratricopeptide repeat protein [Proteobacteria bacterium]|nr:tetratricopeptide repeat protein [Pseudomonadota bacterium]MBS0574407.1 tetratricopeptide repeat protein [Pseudomonadota bacterium]